MKQLKLLGISMALILAAGCASTPKPAAQTAAGSTQVAKASRTSESVIEGDIPAGSPFAKIQIGMTQGQVHEILGQPTDTKVYQTGKAWIPFYFGPDTMRTDEFYKGVGSVTYAGAGVGGVHWKVFRAVYNPAEDGFAN
ncbi:outer membrane protein assembly factor BamE [Methylomonas sp. SURF-2]|uniref:Outer membrane protein assembly factor BamE n=1 Tax=Methylomonas subterranea TaxID=2952225 RepID=A0ABT1TFH7_9GAMM|nr:outer membrane protein assembly factor BamE [Methylomonas sp. SURF-2]MCQ8104210.1 outer membrane protein assembly factor BamE [Methylomonas sp. SURF-2]